MRFSFAAVFLLSILLDAFANPCNTNPPTAITSAGGSTAPPPEATTDPKQSTETASTGGTTRAASATSISTTDQPQSAETASTDGTTGAASAASSSTTHQPQSTDATSASSNAATSSATSAPKSDQNGGVVLNVDGAELTCYTNEYRLVQGDKDHSAAREGLMEGANALCGGMKSALETNDPRTTYLAAWATPQGFVYASADLLTDGECKNSLSMFADQDACVNMLMDIIDLCEFGILDPGEFYTNFYQKAIGGKSVMTKFYGKMAVKQCPRTSVLRSSYPDIYIASQIELLSKRK